MRQTAEQLQGSVARLSGEHAPEDFFGACLEKIENRLADLAPDEARTPERLSKSVRYSLLSPGKRTRALLALLTTHYWDGEPDHAIVPACAVEMVHAASLALDDLPVMDDANLRRGRPTNHRIFGEDTAILSAIALMNDAFGHVSRCADLPEPCRLDVIEYLSASIGLDGLVAGQEMDLHLSGHTPEREEVELIHARKTGALFAASTKIGARIAGLDEGRLADMEEFGMCLGLAFQTYDDLADVHSDEETAGKDVNNDGNKSTLVSLLGRHEAEDIADRHIARALETLEAEQNRSAPLVAYVHHLTDALKKRIDIKR